MRKKTMALAVFIFLAVAAIAILGYQTFCNPDNLMYNPNDENFTNQMIDLSEDSTNYFGCDVIECPNIYNIKVNGLVCPTQALVSCVDVDGTILSEIQVNLRDGGIIPIVC